MAASLKLIKTKLNEALQIFNYNTKANHNQQGQVVSYSFSNLKNIRNIVSILKSIDVFTGATNTILTSAIFTTSTDTMAIQPGETQQLISVLGNLREVMENFISVLGRIVPEENPVSINIKIPDSINDFKKLSDIAKAIDFSISQPLINSDINCETSITGVENGSIWTNVLLIAHDLEAISAQIKIPTAIYFVNRLIKSAIHYRKEWYEGTKLKEEIKKLKTENPDSPDTKIFEETVDKRSDKLLTEEAQSIKDEFYTKNREDVELLNRIKNQLETLSDLLNKGVIITPSLTSTEEVKKEFASVSEMLLLENTTKEIESPKVEPENKDKINEN